jgi:C2 domain
MRCVCFTVSKRSKYSYERFTLFSSSKWIEIGKSEVVKDSLNPRFIKGFQIEYRFEERQKFKIAIYDVDDFADPNNLASHDFIGELEFLLHEVVTARNQQLKKPLVNSKEKGRNNGTIILTAEEDVNNQTETLSFEMHA